MHWPPNKAWTSTSLRKGYRHFVAINYGGKSKERWVNLIAVLDGKATLRISFSEICDESKWISGWLQLPKEESISSHCMNSEESKKSEKNDSSCPHPSEDSGLLIPSRKQIRPWFVEDI